jgi:hypothetical protein
MQKYDVKIKYEIAGSIIFDGQILRLRCAPLRMTHCEVYSIRWQISPLRPRACLRKQERGLRSK